MSDGTDLPVAVIDRLTTRAVGTEMTILDSQTLDEAGDVPDGPFAIFWDAADLLTSDRLDGTRNVYRWGLYLICGGRWPDEMRWAVRFCRLSLADWWIVPDARLSEVLNGAPEIEDSTIPTDVRHTRTLEYRLYTNWS